MLGVEFSKVSENNINDIHVAFPPAPAKTKIFSDIIGTSLQQKDEVEVTAATKSSLPIIYNPVGQPRLMPGSWDAFLSNSENYKLVAPVNYFPNAPLAEIWEEFARPGQKIEVVNPYIDCVRPAMWIAAIVSFCGYKALIEYERFGLLPKHYGWLSYCSSIPKPIGYCDKWGIVLHPQLDVRLEYPDYMERGRESLRGGITIEQNHGEFVERQIRACHRFGLGDLVEALDRTNVTRMRLATVTAIIGDRIHVTYEIEPMPKDPGFWFSSATDLVQRPGWSRTIGHSLYDSDEDFPELEANSLPPYPKNVVLAKGQFLEARHPMKPYQIAIATVHEVLKHGYFIASFITTRKEFKKPILFCYHVTSAFIFPVGFCAKHGIELVPHLNKCVESQNISQGDIAPLHLLPERPDHKFTTSPSLRLEVVDILSPSHIYAGTVIKVIKHLLHIHFDGWTWDDPTCFLWTHARCPEIYPIGYCELIGHVLDI